jgi:bifunctional oligoribonuclease and PAP phosphatase NrnA
MNDSLATIANALRNARSIGVACHVRPDGDAIGSVVALAHSLKLAGKEVHALSEDGVPGNLTFLPETGMVEYTPARALHLDVAVALDTATKDRLGDRTNQAFGTAPMLVNVDHHGTNPRYGHLNHIDTTSPATGQIVYELLAQEKFPINDTVRQNLFAAISTDTGSFQFSSTTPRTHRIIAEMMEAGLDTSTLSQKLYHEHPIRRMHLLKALLNQMKLTSRNRIASWSLTLATQHAAEMLAGDTEGLIDTLRSIEGTMAVVMFEELPEGRVRVSARSKDARLDVSKVCAAFGGGGHKMAAGARLPGPLSEAESRFLETLNDEIERIR